MLEMQSADKQGLFNDDQHEFREEHSCCTQFLEIMEIWTGWWDLGLPWDVIYTYFSKAFNSDPIGFNPKPDGQWPVFFM